MDIATSKTGSSRKEFNRMLEDCKSHKLEIVITKDVSRFGRDTVEVLDIVILCVGSQSDDCLFYVEFLVGTQV